MEFEISNRVIAPIDIINYDSIKQEIINRLERYSNMIYGDNQIAIAKTDRASLNAFYRAIDEKRKEVKAECLRPYIEFERNVSELLDLINAPISLIDKQIKDYENEKKSEKKNRIEQYFEKTILTFRNLKDTVKLPMIFEDRWLNVTVSMKSIEDSIYNKLDKLDNDLNAIKKMNSEYELELLNEYFNTREMSAVINRKVQLEKLKAVQTIVSEVKQETIKVVAPIAIAPITASTIASERVFEITFNTTMSVSQMRAFKQFIDTNNITYQVIKRKEIFNS